MRNRKTLAAVSLFAAGALFLSSCSDSKEPEPTEGSNGGSTGGSEGEYSGNLDIEAGLSTDPITLSIWLQDLAEDDPFTNPVAQAITEATGVSLEIQHPIGGDTDALTLMLTGGEYPDLIHAKGDIGRFIEAEAVIPLDDYIASPLGDNIREFYGESIDRLKHSNANPQTYHVGTGGVENVVLNPSGTMQIQLGALKELGYPEVKTLDDVTNVIRDYLEANPTTEDGLSRIGMTLLTTNWRWLIDLGNPAGYAAGYHDDGQWIVDPDTNEATYKFRHEDIKEYYRWMNALYAEGLLDPESFTQSEDEYNAKVSTGRVVALATQDWAIGGAVNSLRADGKPWATYSRLPVTLDETRMQPDTKDFGYTGTQGIAISSTSEHKERAFKFLDWFATEEAQILNNWGIEGVNYEIVDGKRVWLESDMQAAQEDTKYSLNTGVGAYQHPFPRAGNGAFDSAGQPIDRTALREDLAASYTAEEREVLAAYDAEIWGDLFPAPDAHKPSKHGRVWEMIIPDDVQTKQEQIDNQMPERLKRLIAETSAANFDAEWDQLQTDLVNQGIEELEQAISDAAADRALLWGTA